MTRSQNTLIAAFSLLATVVVLLGGGGAFDGSPSFDAKLLGQRVVDLAGPGTAEVAGDTADSTADDVGSFDGSAEAAAAALAADEVVEDVASDEDGAGGTAPADEEPEPTKIEHVFVIALAGHGFDAAFGPQSEAPYLASELRPRAALLEGYHSLGRADLPDYIAMIGGQPPNDDTRAGCPVFKEISSTATPSKSGEITEPGCVFPNTVTTVADQLTASGRSWKGYVEDIDKGPKGAINCRRPESNAPDDTIKARPGDGYATRHNPFVYFHSLLDLGDCDASNGPLGELEADLVSAKATPSYSFIAPNLCNDGSESPCADGSPGGLPAADAFLAEWVPKILASPAYKKDGLLIVTFAGSVAPDAPAEPGAGEGIRNGALLVSKYAKAGSTAGADYDPYSLLRSVQDLFALKPLARAAGASSFATTVLGDAYLTPPGDG